MLRQQYHFRKYEEDVLIWDVNKIITLSKNLEPREIKLDTIKEFDTQYWYELGGAKPTCKNVVEHIKLINQSSRSKLPYNFM